MTSGPLDSDNETWFPARTDEASPTAPGPQQKLPGGARFGTWLLWLCFGLPGSAALFVLVPGFLGVWGAEVLDKSDVPLEVWSEFEPWMALFVVATLVNHQASFRHRNKIKSESPFGVLWVVAGGVAGLAWLGLLGLERIPKTELNPQLHYWALAGVLVWTGLSLAWASGRVVSMILAPIERRALVSGPLRGSLATAGPISALALVVVGGVSFGLDEDDAVDDMRVLVASSFEDDWSLIETKSEGGGGGSAASVSSKRERESGLDSDCIDTIYEGGESSLFQKAVRSISSYRYVDAEDVAADAAINVCLDKNHPAELSNLRDYYLRSVKNRAKSRYSRHKRFAECSWDMDEPYRIPSGETPQDCLRQQLCRMGPDDQEVLVHLFKGGTARELAGLRMIGQEAAKKQQQRARTRLKAAFRRECMH